MKVLWIMAACAAMAVPAAAQVRVIDDGRSESAPEMKATADGKLICKAHKQTGSRLAKQKECRTAAEWVAVREKAKSVHDDLTRKSMSNNCIQYGSGSGSLGQGSGCAGG